MRGTQIEELQNPTANTKVSRIVVPQAQSKGGRFPRWEGLAARAMRMAAAGVAGIQ